MNVLEVPFNKFLGIQKADPASGRLLTLPASPSYTNHLGTVHAGVQMALAEASSAECLLATFPDFAPGGTLAVVRRVEAKFKNPLAGSIFTKASINEADARKLSDTLSARGRGMIVVSVEVLDAAGTVGMVSSFEWFVQRQKA